MRRSVYIPVVVRADDGPHRLLHLYADRTASFPGDPSAGSPDRDANKAGLDPMQHRLRTRLHDVGLYVPATAALKAVRALAMRPPVLALYQRLRREPQWLEHLEIDLINPTHGITEPDSATLGLALLMLMQGAGTRTRRVLATGTIVVSPDERRAGDGIRVAPVGHLYEKLQLALAMGKQKEPLLFFVPNTENDGSLTRDDPLLGPEIQALENLNIRVRPVATLLDAATALGISRGRLVPRDLLVVGLLLLAVLVAGASWWLSRPVALTLVPYQDTHSGASLPSPFRVGASGLARPMCSRGDGTYAAVVEDWIYFQVRVGDASRPDLPVHVAAVGVSQASPPKVYVPQSDEEDCARSPVAAGQLWCYRVRTTERPEVNAIVILAQRLRAFDADALESKIRARFPDNESRSDVTAQRNFLEGLGQGAVSRVFETVSGREGCT